MREGGVARRVLELEQLPASSPPGGFPETGTLIGGVYRVVGLLGAGAMGVVLKAEDETLGRTVAIKFVHPGRLNERFRQRFREEAQAMARVRHPNTLQVYAYGEHEGAPYFVMEYVDGHTLDQWLIKGGASTLAAALELLAQTCDGVAAIHAEHTVHRDLKPTNVLIDRTGRARVADLGLALHEGADEEGCRREVVGTPTYMAPEVALATEPQASLQSADVYSLGCIAYEVLTGAPPFQATTHHAMMVQHVVSLARPPSERRPELPAHLDGVVLGALAKEPKDRTRSAAAFGAALRNAADQLTLPERVLVAEDSDDFRAALEIALTSAFPLADIECVANGRAALEAYDRKKPSVAILDLRMPGFDGLQLTSLLRARHPDAKVPIIVVSASGGPADWKRLSAMGANRFLLKPVHLDDVVTMVRRVLKENSAARPLKQV